MITDRSQKNSVLSIEITKINKKEKKLYQYKWRYQSFIMVIWLVAKISTIVLSIRMKKRILVENHLICIRDLKLTEKYSYRWYDKIIQK